MIKRCFAVLGLLCFLNQPALALEWTTWVHPGIVQLNKDTTAFYMHTAGASAEPLGMPGCPSAYVAVVGSSTNTKRIHTAIEIARASGTKIRFGGSCHPTQSQYYIMVDYIHQQ